MSLILALSIRAAGPSDSEKKPEPAPASAPVAEPAATPAKAGYSVEIGFEERVRSENWNNIIDQNAGSFDERHHVRFRTKLWTKWNFANRLELMVSFNNESRKTSTPSIPFKLDEVVFENCYADFKFSPQVSVRVGRQNIMRGEGFIIFDGNALDGSRTAYFNAGILTLSRKKSKLEFMGISNPRQDIYFPVANTQNRNLTEWDEQAAGMYYTDGNHPRSAWEAYYFYKRETRNFLPSAHAQYQPERRFSTLGARLVQKLPRNFSLTGEFAGQWGTRHAADSIRAWGGYAYLKKEFPVRTKPSLQAGYLGLSGDDPNTTSVEGWDPLFSRWPKWSELYIYTLSTETGAAYWTNLSALQVEFLISPVKRLDFRATYYHLHAFQPYAKNPAGYGHGKNRGDLFQARLDFTLSKGWKGHLLYEGFAPGGFYRHGESGYFLRFELSYQFKQIFSLWK